MHHRLSTGEWLPGLADASTVRKANPDRSPLTITLSPEVIEAIAHYCLEPALATLDSDPEFSREDIVHAVILAKFREQVMALVGVTEELWFNLDDLIPPEGGGDSALSGKPV